MRSLLILLAVLLPLPASAAQSLVPSPYPSGSPGAAPLNPAPTGAGGGQTNMQSPYPQPTGGSQGNPSDVTPGGAQQRVPSTFRRNYGVDRH